MPTPEPREPVVVVIATDEIPRGMYHSLTTALAEAAADLGIGIGSYLQPADQYRNDSAEAKVHQLRARVADLKGHVRQAEVERQAAYQLAQAAEKRADELLWIESTSCCGDQANQYGVRARNAEAAVERVRQLARDRWRYVNPDQRKIGPAELIAHLDRAGVPAETSPSD
ncbi:hypothetical protein MXD62_19545 [Frankia sp. Mgl5]|uniref:hypothetical protein n=1 Tax=Frankia sp. Mgl5 TaxID=2933793 RepID=UPI00200C6DA1|nr:hypothetical protein [Frankia sp. Mgl5]MCK9929347.1 hypothetical protein [Frankia sp. Mgl5]